MKKTIFAAVFAVIASSQVHAQEVLPVDDAFSVSHLVSQEKFLVNFDIADGYRLYKDSIKMSDNVAVSMVHDIPAGKSGHDEFKGEVKYLDQPFQISGKIKRIKGDRFTITYQGCKPNSVCYPPQKHEIVLP